MVFLTMYIQWEFYVEYRCVYYGVKYTVYNTQHTQYTIHSIHSIQYTAIHTGMLLDIKCGTLRKVVVTDAGSSKKGRVSVQLSPDENKHEKLQYVKLKSGASLKNRNSAPSLTIS